jgi:penicillin-binding protein 2
MNGGKGRILALQISAILIFLVLGLRLWHLQILRGDYYKLLAERNRLRLVQTDALRGIIYDRWGRPLVKNTPSYTVLVVPADLPEEEGERRQVLSKLSELLFPLGKSASLASPSSSSPDLESLVKEGMKNPYKPIVVKRNVDRETAFLLQQEHLSFPGVQVKIEPMREYISSTLFSHIVGYTAPIPKEWEQEYKAKGYDPSRDKIGITGVEFVYEDYLKGEKGQKLVEVDASGREIRTVGKEIPPTPGYSLYLTIDWDLQAAVEEALAEGMKRARSPVGVAIVMDPRNGQILAMVSLPSYDNNLFARGISYEDYRRLEEDPNHPLVNHATMGTYPTGSTFKIVPATAALEEGIISERTYLDCEGILLVPHQYFPDDPNLAQPFYCWIHKYGKGHGPINVIDAIAYSCDIFFYKVAGGYKEFRGLGLDKLTYWAKLFGFGERTGIDLPSESKGLVPSADWKRLNYGETWVLGDTYNLAIGQGFFLATPLQLLNATAAIANGGTLYRPQLVYKIVDYKGNVVKEFKPEIIRTIPASEKTIALVKRGLREAVTRGTAWRTNWPDIPVAGKTGTAEFYGPRDVKGHLPTHAWFTAFAPYDNPKIALVVFLQGGGEGSEAAVPVAAKIIRYYFDYIDWER